MEDNFRLKMEDNLNELLKIETFLKLFGIFVAGKVTLWLADYVYRIWSYSKVPGPFNVPFIGNSWRLLGEKSDFLQTILSMNRDYEKEPFYRVWVGPTTVVSFDKPDNLAAIFNAFNDKGDTYKLLEPWLKTGLLTSGGDKWLHRRKMLTPSFHFDILKDYYMVMSDHAEKFVEKLNKMDLSKPINLAPHIGACTLDIICETAMGYSINAQSGENTEYVSTIAEMCDTLVKRQQRPWLMFDTIFRLSSVGKRQAQCLKILHGFTKKVIQERAEDFKGVSRESVSANRKRIDFLDLLLDIKLPYPETMSFEDIQEEVDTFMFEGHDTTSAALTWAFFMIATHPEVQKKLHEEIEDVLKNTSHVTLDDLSKMTYLECVIKETLRLFPPVPFIARKVTHDLVIDGYNILKGTDIFVMIYSVHRDKRYFPNPEEFKPERFLPANTADRHPYVYLPFSFGKRNCIGQRFAMMELKVILANMLRNFEFSCSQTVDEVKPSNEVILRPQNEILIQLKSTKTK